MLVKIVLSIVEVRVDLNQMEPLEFKTCKRRIQLVVLVTVEISL